MIVTYWDVGGAEEVTEMMDREKCRSRLLRGYETIRIIAVWEYGLIIGVKVPESGEWLKVQLQVSVGV